jgi:hypothetical protein
MAHHFCPICGMQHEPDVPCFDLAKQSLKDTGLPLKQQVHSERRLKGWARIIMMMIVILIGVTLICAVGIAIYMVIWEVK